MREKIEEALKNIRLALQADGGDVELVEVTDDGVVKVRLKGACGGCPMSQLTLKQGIERRVRAPDGLSTPQILRQTSARWLAASGRFFCPAAQPWPGTTWICSARPSRSSFTSTGSPAGNLLSRRCRSSTVATGCPPRA
jgi:hypothetical protein